jgi:uncharacterized protein with HEPN domain
MTQHDEYLRLHHMRDHGREALELAREIDRTTFRRDRLRQLAIARLLEIVGEAAAQTTDEVRRRRPEIPWRDVSDLRNRLIHGYDTVDLDIVWSILSVDLPALVAQLDAILEPSIE